MSTKLQKYKRKTRQIRIDNEIHHNLKLQAFLSDATISELADEIIGEFLKRNLKDIPPYP